MCFVFFLRSLFKRLDVDHSGYLEGEEYTKIMEELTQYMLKQWHDAGYVCVGFFFGMGSEAGASNSKSPSVRRFPI